MQLSGSVPAIRFRCLQVKHMEAEFGRAGAQTNPSIVQGDASYDTPYQKFDMMPPPPPAPPLQPGENPRSAAQLAAQVRAECFDSALIGAITLGAAWSKAL